jgi:hypothetical protein
MTLEEIEQYLWAIEAETSGEFYPPDKEAGQLLEEILHQSVLKHIATHCKDEECKKLASQALKSLDIEFARWYDLNVGGWR